MDNIHQWQLLKHTSCFSNNIYTNTNITRSVAIGFGQHDMPPPASNDTDNTICPHRPLMTQIWYWAKTAQDWSRDLATLTWPWSSWHLWLTWVIVLHPYTKFEVRRPIWKIWCTMCVSINWPSDHDLETGMRVAPKVGNLPSKFGHTSPLGSQIIRYVRDGWMDRQIRQMDGWTKAMLIAPSLWTGAQQYKVH